MHMARFGPSWIGLAKGIAIFSGGIGILWAQLPTRYVLKLDALSFLSREHRITGEYRLFRWAPPFIASVERARWEGLTVTLSLSYYRYLPQRGAIGRPGARYYFWKRPYTPEGLWVGLHGAIASWAARREKAYWSAGAGLSLGYQHLFRQAYGAAVEPYLLAEVLSRRPPRGMALQVGLNVGFAARKWDRRNLP